MNCPNCFKSIPDNATSCRFCGKDFVSSKKSESLKDINKKMAEQKTQKKPKKKEETVKFITDDDSYIRPDQIERFSSDDETVKFVSFVEAKEDKPIIAEIDKKVTPTFVKRKEKKKDELLDDEEFDDEDFHQRIESLNAILDDELVKESYEYLVNADIIRHEADPMVKEPIEDRPEVLVKEAKLDAVLFKTKVSTKEASKKKRLLEEIVKMQQARPYHFFSKERIFGYVAWITSLAAFICVLMLVLSRIAVNGLDYSQPVLAFYDFVLDFLVFKDIVVVVAIIFMIVSLFNSFLQVYSNIDKYSIVTLLCTFFVCAGCVVYLIIMKDFSTLF